MQKLTILAGQSVSDATHVNRGQRLFSLWTIDGWDAADLQLEIADVPNAVDGDYLPICRDEAGAPPYLIPFDSGKRLALDNNAMSLASVEGFVRVRSVAAGGGADVAQTTTREINLDLK